MPFPLNLSIINDYIAQYIQFKISKICVLKSINNNFSSIYNNNWTKRKFGSVSVGVSPTFRYGWFAKQGIMSKLTVLSMCVRDVSM